ncbi:hypothetical protein AGMMS49965_26270 [Bacteroidia bacterium]|nr:hypothetical protein AGMMS49965_26270 [Bacteroidia bacterium]
MIKMEGVAPQMIANNLTPHKPTHPGRLLLREVEYLNLSQRELAQQIGMPYSDFHAILNAKQPITPVLAKMLEALNLGWDAEELLSGQARYDSIMASRKPQSKNPFAALRKVAAVFA